MNVRVKNTIKISVLYIEDAKFEVTQNKDGGTWGLIKALLHYVFHPLPWSNACDK